MSERTLGLSMKLDYSQTYRHCVNQSSRSRVVTNHQLSSQVQSSSCSKDFICLADSTKTQVVRERRTARSN